jgi:hypothetical protein
MVMTNNDTNTALSSGTVVVEPVKYGKVVRVTSLKRDTNYAQKRWIEQRNAKSGGAAKWIISKVLFLGASWHGIGQWLKDGELPMLKVSDGLGYYFQVGSETIVAHVKDRCLFLGDNRLTFSELLGGEVAVQEEAPSGADSEPEVNEVHPMDDEELTDALIDAQTPLALCSNPLDGELVEDEAPTKTKAKKRK